MRILLIEPPIVRHDVGTGIIALPEPIALECIAALLEAHEVRILDMRIEKRGLRRELRRFRPRVVAAGGCAVAVNNVKTVLREAKAFDPNILTVAGGMHATLLPRDFDDPCVDLVVIGEGEHTFRDAVAAFDRAEPFDGVPGLGFRRDGRFVLTPEAPLLDLDKLPFPARELVARYRYRYFRGKWRPIALVYTSRGCPFKCSFCAMWKVNRGTYRRRSPERIVEELETIPEQYVDFVDDNSFADPRWAQRLCDLIGERGIHKTYKAYSRSDVIAGHPGLIRAWKEIGLEIVLVGFEAVRDIQLADYKKKSSVRENEKAIEVLKENDVEMAAYFVVHPDFTAEDFEALKRYIDKWELLHPVFTVLTPFPGTDLFESRRGELQGVDYELLDFFHAALPTRLPTKEFYERFVDLYEYAYSFRRTFRYRRREKAIGLSPRQIAMGIRFFRQLKQLKRACQP